MASANSCSASAIALVASSVESLNSPKISTPVSSVTSRTETILFIESVTDSRKSSNPSLVDSNLSNTEVSNRFIVSLVIFVKSVKLLIDSFNPFIYS